MLCLWQQHGDVHDAARQANGWVPVLVRRAYAGRVTTVTWSPDSGKLLSAGEDPAACVWTQTALDGKEAPVILPHCDTVVEAACWAPDSQRILTGSHDHLGRIWQASGDTWHLLADLRGHTAKITAADWAPSGDKVVTGGGDRTVRVWRAISGSRWEMMARLDGHTTVVSSVAWWPLGDWLASASCDARTIVWQPSRSHPQQWEATSLSLAAVTRRPGTRVGTGSPQRMRAQQGRAGGRGVR